jgi:Na+/H+ antiporter NhaD/arsenite permease-like protein
MAEYAVAMKGWWLPWLFPAVLLGAVLLIVVLGNDAAYLGAPVGLAALVGACFLWRARYGPSKDDPDADVKYWRLPGARPRS